MSGQDNDTPPLKMGARGDLANVGQVATDRELPDTRLHSMGFGVRIRLPHIPNIQRCQGAPVGRTLTYINFVQSPSQRKMTVLIKYLTLMGVNGLMIA